MTAADNITPIRRAGDPARVDLAVAAAQTGTPTDVANLLDVLAEADETALAPGIAHGPVLKLTADQRRHGLLVMAASLLRRHSCSPLTACTRCGGTGVVGDETPDYFGLHESRDCPKCDGVGSTP